MRAALALVPSQPIRDPIAQAVNNVVERYAYFSVLTPEQQEQRVRAYALETVKAVLALTKSEIAVPERGEAERINSRGRQDRRPCTSASSAIPAGSRVADGRMASALGQQPSPTPLRSLPQAERENRGSGQLGETTGRDSYRCIYCNRQVADLDDYEPYCGPECAIDAQFNR